MNIECGDDGEIESESLSGTIAALVIPPSQTISD